MVAGGGLGVGGREASHGQRVKLGGTGEHTLVYMHGTECVRT